MKARFSTQYKPWLVKGYELFPNTGIAYIFLDPAGMLVATDTKTLICIPCDLEDVPKGFAGALVPPAFLKGLAQQRPQRTGQVEFGIEFASRRLIGVTPTGEWQASLPSEELRFPRWRRVFGTLFAREAELDPEAFSCFHTRRLAAVADVLGLNKNEPILVYRPIRSGPILVLGSGGAFGLLLPGEWKGDAPSSLLENIRDIVLSARSD